MVVISHCDGERKLQSVKCSQSVAENDSALFVADTVDIIKLMSVKAFVAVFESDVSLDVGSSL